MIIHDEIRKIAEINELREFIIQGLENRMDIDGLDFSKAVILNGCKERDGHLFDTEGKQLDIQGMFKNEYYCEQHQGYVVDDFYGNLYYPTSKTGVFIRIPYSTY